MKNELTDLDELDENHFKEYRNEDCVVIANKVISLGDSKHTLIIIKQIGGENHGKYIYWVESYFPSKICKTEAKILAIQAHEVFYEETEAKILAIQAHELFYEEVEKDTKLPYALRKKLLSFLLSSIKSNNNQII